MHEDQNNHVGHRMTHAHMIIIMCDCLCITFVLRVCVCVCECALQMLYEQCDPRAA